MLWIWGVVCTFLGFFLSHCVFKAVGIKRRLLDRWREAGPTQLDSTSLIGSPTELLIRSLRNWYARAGNTHGEWGVASRALCMLTFWWKIGDKDGFQVLSDTRRTERKNISVLGEPGVPLPLSTSATWTIQREGDPDWSLPRLQAELQISLFQQHTAHSSSHSSFLVVGSPARLETQLEGMLRWQRGLSWRSPACLTAPCSSKGSVCSFKGMSWNSLEQEIHFSCWTRWNSHCYLIYISMLVTYRWLLFIDM